MSDYNKEQIITLNMVREYLSKISPETLETHKKDISDYLAFRKKVALFSEQALDHICKKKCFDTGLSACCTKEGIITYFADIFVNAVMSSPKDLDAMKEALYHPDSPKTCVYLGKNGCLFHVKPIVCEMFFCDPLINESEKETPGTRQDIEALKKEQKQYTWPDKPVYFDMIEAHFIKQGYRSPLMYMHNSPGLIRIKKNAGLI